MHALVDLIRLRFAQLDLKPLPNPDASVSRLQLILSIVFTVTGAIAVLIIVIAGFRYVTARDDAGAVGAAKNTIIYAVVGLVVSVTAFSIVNFVVEGI